VNPAHRSQRIIVKKDEVVTTNKKKDPYAYEAQEIGFTQTFKKKILEPLAATNGFRIATGDGVYGGYDVVLGEPRKGTVASFDFARLVTDTSTNTPILFFLMTGSQIDPPAGHAIGCIYFPAETRIEMFTTYPVKLPEVTKFFKVVPKVGGRKTYRRKARKTRRRRTLRKHK
jgi:hypothetical protein